MTAASKFGRLGIQYVPTNPAKPELCGVFIGNKMVAMLTLESVKETAAQIAEMEKKLVGPG